MQINLDARNPKANEAAELVRAIVTARYEDGGEELGTWMNLVVGATDRCIKDPEFLAYVLAVGSTVTLGVVGALARSQGVEPADKLAEVFTMLMSDGITF